MVLANTRNSDFNLFNDLGQVYGGYPFYQSPQEERADKVTFDHLLEAQAQRDIEKRLQQNAAPGALQQPIPSLSSPISGILGKSLAPQTPVAPPSDLGMPGTTGLTGTSNGAEAVAGESDFASQYLAPVAAVHGGYNTIKNISDNKKDIKGGALSGAEAGVGIGMMVGGPKGAAIGSVIGAIIGGVGGAFGGSTDEHKARRTAFKDAIAAGSGFGGGNLSFSGAGGQQLNIYDAGYEIDNSNPLSQLALTLANPFAHFLASNQPEEYRRELAAAFAGQLTNTVVLNAKSPGDVVQNMIAFAQKLGVTPASIRSGFSQMLKNGAITKSEYDVFLRDFNKLVVKRKK